MAQVVRTRVLPHPPAAAWAVLADFGALSTWAPNVDHSVVLHAADEAVGQVRRVQTGRTTLLERVVTWDEPRVLAYTIEGLPKVVRHVRNQWTLEPTGAGAEVRLTTDVDCGPRPPQQLVARLVARRLARESDRLLDGLAVALERSHA